MPLVNSYPGISNMARFHEVGEEKQGIHDDPFIKPGYFALHWINFHWDGLLPYE